MIWIAPSRQGATTVDAVWLASPRPEVDEVSHYGHAMRVATRGIADPVAFVRETLAGAGITLHALVPVRVTVEDAFVSTVRQETQSGTEARA